MFVLQDENESKVRINCGLRQEMVSGQKVLLFESMAGVRNMPGKASEPKAEGIVIEAYNDESIVKII